MLGMVGLPNILARIQARISFLSLMVLMPQVNQWTSACLEGCMKRLTSMNKPYKYVVTCIIMQKTGNKSMLSHNMDDGADVAATSSSSICTSDK